LECAILCFFCLIGFLDRIQLIFVLIFVELDAIAAVILAHVPALRKRDTWLSLEGIFQPEVVAPRMTPQMAGAGGKT
jgi:hypothetical protein